MAVERVVGISEYIVSRNPGDTLVTYSLGSCIALVLYDAVAGVGGMLHAMMPASKANPAKASATPAMYADTGSQMMLQEMFQAGATRSNLAARVVGAAAQFEDAAMFRIGERNHAVVRKVLWKNGILIAAEDVGGTSSRTVYLDIGSGSTIVKTPTGTSEL